MSVVLLARPNVAEAEFQNVCEGDLGQCFVFFCVFSP